MTNNKPNTYKITKKTKPYKIKFLKVNQTEVIIL